MKILESKRSPGVALGQPRFHVRDGLQMAVNHNFPRKVNFNLEDTVDLSVPFFFI